MYYGWKGLISILSLATSPSLERDFNKYLPGGIACLTDRIAVDQIDEAGLAALEDLVVDSAKRMSTADIKLFVFACTSGSLIKGIGYDQHLIRRMEEATGGIPCFTTTTAVVEALRAVNAKKVVVATPYCDRVNEIEKKFLEDSGFEVLDIRGLGVTDPKAIPRVQIDELYHLTMSMDCSQADAVFISCTGLCFLDYVPELEEELGMPLVTSIQATMWKALRAIGRKDDLGLGGLFKL